ncbi:lipoprotein [Flavobacterium oreochromis]
MKKGLFVFSVLLTLASCNDKKKIKILKTVKRIIS